VGTYEQDQYLADGTFVLKWQLHWVVGWDPATNEYRGHQACDEDSCRILSQLIRRGREPPPDPAPGCPSPRQVTAPGCYGQGRARGTSDTRVIISAYRFKKLVMITRVSSVIRSKGLGDLRSPVYAELARLVYHCLRRCLQMPNPRLRAPSECFVLAARHQQRERIAGRLGWWWSRNMPEELGKPSLVRRSWPPHTRPPGSARHHLGAAVSGVVLTVWRPYGDRAATVWNSF
jgi:hypothetical protein